MLPVSPDLKKDIRDRNLAMNWLLTHFPQAFNLGNRKPLAEMILSDILATQHDDMPEKEALEGAISYYTEWGSYLNALKAGAIRVDLKGQAVALVDKKAEAQAQSHLLKAREKFS
jgi:sRNA-binding protein